MKRITVLAILLLPLFAAQMLCAQGGKDFVRENHDRAAANYHYYEFFDTGLTPAPKGYRPVYISHYSRHGSRYHASARFFRPMAQLKVCDSLGLLSETGKKFYADALAVMDEHQGMYGMLSARGAGELRGVGERLYERFPELFSGRDGRNLVRNYSTTVQRSMLSMMNMMSVLAGKSCGKMEFSYVTGEKYHDYLCHETDNYLPAGAFDNEVEDAGLPELDTDLLFGIFFNDPEAAAGVTGRKKAAFMRNLYKIAAISPNTDCRPDLLAYFPEEELLKFWKMRNNYFYAGFANSTEMFGEVKQVSRPIINDFIAKADEALSDGSNVAGDFRFGHDTGLLPLIAHLGISGMEECHSAYEAHEYWDSSLMIPMASNIQMIFYSGRKGDVLVKILYNERETLIPALKPVQGPYYSWKDLRSYMSSLL